MAKFTFKNINNSEIEVSFELERMKKTNEEEYFEIRISEGGGFSKIKSKLTQKKIEIIHDDDLHGDYEKPSWWWGENSAFLIALRDQYNKKGKNDFMVRDTLISESSKMSFSATMFAFGSLPFAIIGMTIGLFFLTSIASLPLALLFVFSCVAIGVGLYALFNTIIYYRRKNDFEQQMKSDDHKKKIIFQNKDMDVPTLKELLDELPISDSDKAAVLKGVFEKPTKRMKIEIILIEKEYKNAIKYMVYAAKNEENKYFHQRPGYFLELFEEFYEKIDKIADKIAENEEKNDITPDIRNDLIDGLNEIMAHFQKESDPQKLDVRELAARQTFEVRCLLKKGDLLVKQGKMQEAFECYDNAGSVLGTKGKLNAHEKQKLRQEIDEKTCFLMESNLNLNFNKSAEKSEKNTRMIGRAIIMERAIYQETENLTEQAGQETHEKSKKLIERLTTLYDREGTGPQAKHEQTSHKRSKSLDK